MGSWVDDRERIPELEVPDVKADVSLLSLLSPTGIAYRYQ